MNEFAEKVCFKMPSISIFIDLILLSARCIEKPRWSQLIIPSFNMICEFFTHMETSTLPVKGFKIFTYAGHSRLLRREGSLACPIYWDTGHPFKVVISEHPWHSNMLLSAWRWSCQYLFLRLRSVASKMEPQSPACKANALPLNHTGIWKKRVRSDSVFAMWSVNWIVFIITKCINL